MQQWNAVVTVYDFRRACDVLGGFGRVQRTDFYNTLFINARDISGMLETMREKSSDDPEFLSFLSRLIPVTGSFMFQSPEEFEGKAKEIALSFARGLGGKRFHVRMKRRGFKGRLSSLEEERFLDDVLLEALKEGGNPGHISFEDPDAVIAVETVANWAGMSIWTREQLQRYPFIRIT